MFSRNFSQKVWEWISAISTLWPYHSVKKRGILSHQKNISSNQFSKTNTFTKIFAKNAWERIPVFSTLCGAQSGKYSIYLSLTWNHWAGHSKSHSEKYENSLLPDVLHLTSVFHIAVHLQCRNLAISTTPILREINFGHFDCLSSSEFWIFGFLIFSSEKSKFKAFNIVKITLFHLLKSVKIDFT